MTTPLFVGALTAWAVMSTTGFAQDPEKKNRFHVGGRLHFNVTAELRNLPAPAGPATDYDDGFVRPDISWGPAGLTPPPDGNTWHWGYSFTNQIVGSLPNLALELHRAPSPRDGVTDDLDDDYQYGFELGYGRELLRFGNEQSPIVFGLEASFGSSALNLEAANTVSGSVTRTATRYLLGSVIPPANAPYFGPFEGPVPPNPPAPLIAGTGTAFAPSTENVTSTQRAQIEGVFYGFRIGPFFEIPLPGRFGLQIGGGYAMVHADADLSYTETFTTTGLGGPPQPRTDKRSSNEWLSGFYGEAKLQYWLSDAMSLYVGGQYEAIDDFEMRALNREATVNFGETFGIVVGATWAF